MGYLYSYDPSGSYVNTGIELIWLNSNRDIEKSLFLHKGGDYNLNGDYAQCSQNINEFEFLIDKNNLLYQPLQAFLTDKDEIIIDDDDTNNLNEKTMTIKKAERDILITFKNYKEKKSHYILIIYLLKIYFLIIEVK